jgi:SAM-dependent methyltransferase
MAASIALDELRHRKRPLRVLDPMAGSGTTLVVAKNQGHRAVGFDTDPMARLLAKAWSMNVREAALRRAAKRALQRAAVVARRLQSCNAFPCPTRDAETRAFIRYWFDAANRRQLTALARTIAREHDARARTLLWCAFSRMIITKQASVSLAMDLAHSRPHRARGRSNIRPFNRFLPSVEAVIAAAPFRNKGNTGQADVREADARALPIRSRSIDLVITSPPYLNAIDYLRCHKFSLVWMGFSVGALRQIRATNVGTEVGLYNTNRTDLAGVVDAMTGHKPVSPHDRGMLQRYVTDMEAVVREIARVLVPGGRATFVVGNCTLRGVYVKNSRAIALLGRRNGLRVVSTKSRVLPDNRRYLPPPSQGAGAMRNRLRTEVVMTLKKVS